MALQNTGLNQQKDNDKKIQVCIKDDGTSGA